MHNEEKSKTLFVFLSPVEWTGIRQRPHHLAVRLARVGNVLYVNPFGLRSIRFSDFPRLANRLISMWRPHTGSTDNNPNVVSPLFIPLQGKLWQVINRYLVARQIRKQITNYPDCRVIVWTEYPTPHAHFLAKRLNASQLVFDCIDDYASFHSSPKLQTAIQNETRALLTSADVTFASSEHLAEKLGSNERAITVVRNGVEISHFHANTKDFQVPFEVANLAKPIIGYIGMISSWFDIQAIKMLSETRPDYQIVLIGPTEIDLSQLRKHPNIHILGKKSYEELPSYLQEMTVCIIPFLVNTLTKAVNPVKVYEYLAAGKPVVSSALPEVCALTPLVYIYETTDKFVKSVDQAISERNQRASERQEFARQHDWDNRIRVMLQHINMPSS